MEMRSEHARKRWFYPIFIVTIGFCYYITYFNYGINLGDEGFFVYGAERVLHGQLPMSDFMAYPPGSYFVLALLFRVFGTNLWVSRFMEIAFLLLDGLLIFYVSRRLMPDSWALIPSFILVLFPGPWYKIFFTFGLLLPLFSLFRFLEKGTTGRVMMVGASIGISLLFKFESGLYSSVAVGVAIFLNHVWKDGHFLLRRRALWDFTKDIFFCSIGFLSVLSPFLIYYISHSALLKSFYTLRERYESQAIGWVGEMFEKPSLLSALTKFQLGGLKHLFFYLIVILYLYVFFKVITYLFIQKRKDFSLLLPVLILGSLSLTYAYIAFSKAYLLHSVAMAYILFGFVLHSYVRKGGVRSRVLLIFLLLLLGLYVIDNLKMRGYHSGNINMLFRIEREGASLVESKKARVYVSYKQLDTINGLTQFFKGKDGYLLPLPYDPMVNFLTGLQNPTRFSFLIPPFLSEVSRQKEVINEVERYKIHYLLIHRWLWISAGEQGFSSYAPILYEFISRHYQLEKEIGGYLIFSRQ